MASRNWDESSVKQAQNANQAFPKGTFPSHNGNAYHTLTEAQLAEMTEHLLQHEPRTTSAALSLLLRSFPETPVDLRLKACAAYTERLKIGT